MIANPQAGMQLIDSRGRNRAEIVEIVDGIALLYMWPIKSKRRRGFHLPVKAMQSRMCGWRVAKRLQEAKDVLGI